MSDPGDQLLYSTSARDLIALAAKYPDIVSGLKNTRPVLNRISEGIEKLEESLDAERRTLIHANEERLRLYMEAVQNWLMMWTEVQKEISGYPLLEAHKIIVNWANGVLPFLVK